MPRLHDPATKAAMIRRIQTLTPTSQRRWGRMTIGQMLWHVNTAMAAAMGKESYGEVKPMPFPKWFMRFAVLNFPWVKGKTPTLPKFEAKDDKDFEAERRRLLGLIDEFTAKDLAGTWATHPLLGTPSGEFNTRLQARHLNHHLEQFGA